MRRVAVFFAAWFAAVHAIRAQAAVCDSQGLAAASDTAVTSFRSLSGETRDNLTNAKVWKRVVTSAGDTLTIAGTDAWSGEHRRFGIGIWWNDSLLFTSMDRYGWGLEGRVLSLLPDSAGELGLTIQRQYGASWSNHVEDNLIILYPSTADRNVRLYGAFGHYVIGPPGAPAIMAIPVATIEAAARCPSMSLPTTLNTVTIINRDGGIRRSSSKAFLGLMANVAKGWLAADGLYAQRAATAGQTASPSTVGIFGQAKRFIGRNEIEVAVILISLLLLLAVVARPRGAALQHALIGCAIVIGIGAVGWYIRETYLTKPLVDNAGSLSVGQPEANAGGINEATADSMMAARKVVDELELKGLITHEKAEEMRRRIQNYPADRDVGNAMADLCAGDAYDPNCAAWRAHGGRAP